MRPTTKRDRTYTHLPSVPFWPAAAHESLRFDTLVPNVRRIWVCLTQKPLCYTSYSVRTHRGHGTRILPPGHTFCTLPASSATPMRVEVPLKCVVPRQQAYHQPHCVPLQPRAKRWSGAWSWVILLIGFGPIEGTHLSLPVISFTLMPKCPSANKSLCVCLAGITQKLLGQANLDSADNTLILDPFMHISCLIRMWHPRTSREVNLRHLIA